MIDLRPPRSFRDWEALLGARSSCSEETASALRLGTVEPAVSSRVFKLVQDFVERALSAEKDRYLDSIDDLGNDLDGFELATKRFLLGSQRCLTPLECEGLPEESAKELKEEAKAYVASVFRSVLEAVSSDESGNAEYVVRRTQRLWQRQ